VQGLPVSVLLGALSTQPTPPSHIYDGTPTTTCQWPTTVTFDFVGCSGTLVSPWIVTTAAHCVGDAENPGQVLFGDSAAAPERTAAVEYCRRSPDWDFDIDSGVGGNDFSFCKLTEPIYDYPVTPIVYGCEVEILSPGREVWIVGFGRDSDDGESGTKRMGLTEIVSVDENIYGDGIRIGSPEHDSCPGDSGGPAYVQYPDGTWHVFGVVSGGPAGCGNWPTEYAAIHAWVPWVEEQSGIDVTPCHDTDGTWNPTGWCQGFELDPFDGGEWSQICAGEVSGASATCGPAFDEMPDDAAPQVVLTSPADATIYDTAPASVALVIDADDGGGWGVRSVSIEVDGVVQPFELRDPPFEFTAEFPQGGYELVAIAEDWAGNVGRSDVVRIAVDADLPPLPDPGTSSGTADSSGGHQGSDGAADTSTTSTGVASGPDGSTGGANQADTGSTGGCACTQTPTDPRGALASATLLLLAFANRRPRSRRPTRPADDRPRRPRLTG
jgi:hypothetical protein